MMDLRALIHRFDDPSVQAIVLMGSHARGDVGPYSDVDLVRFVEEAYGELRGAGSHLINGVLVVVSNVTLRQVEPCFSDPLQAKNTIAGLRTARALLDRDGTFDNSFFAEVAAVVGADSLWSQLCALAFGVADVHGRPPSWRERVVVGLHLYGVTAELLSAALQPKHAPLVAETVVLINTALEAAYHGE